MKTNVSTAPALPWVVAAERKPKPGKTVLVFVPIFGRCPFQLAELKGKEFYSLNGYPLSRWVTHWLPLDVLTPAGEKLE